jgi:SAM-dependent methyltransferase
MIEWHDKFFSGIYSQVLARLFDETTNRRQAKIIKHLLKLRRGQSVLDIPCGQGRLTLIMARLGLHATGVDRQISYINLAKLAAKRREIKANFLTGDMRQIIFKEKFDGVFNWFGSFGYFSDKENQAVLEHYFEALKPGGRLLVDCPNKDWILKNFKKRMDLTVDDIQTIQKSHWLKREQRIRTSWTFIRGRRKEHYVVNMRLFNMADLRDLLKKSGFGEIKFFTGLGENLTRNLSPRIIVVARKA